MADLFLTLMDDRWEGSLDLAGLSLVHAGHQPDEEEQEVGDAREIAARLWQLHLKQMLTIIFITTIPKN